MLKVVTLLGTRPELIKLSLVIAELDRHVEHVLVHSGQNHDFELNEIFFRDLAIRKPDHFLDAAGGTSAETIARIIERFDKVLAVENPDALLVLGDTNSCLGVIPAKRRKVPIFHMEAGNRCFDFRVPEEINRRIVDHVSDINLVYTEHARRHLLAEGMRADMVIKTGSPMREVLAAFSDEIDRSDVLSRLGLARGGFFLVSAHREENVDVPERLRMLIDTVAVLAATFDKRVVFSAHPRTRARVAAFGIQLPDSVEFMNPMGFFEYVKLQTEAFCVVSDSGTLTEESAILGFPAVSVREAHERPEGMDEAVVMMSDLPADRVVQAVTIATAPDACTMHSPVDYDADNVARKIVRLIVSYTDFVRRNVWRQ